MGNISENSNYRHSKNYVIIYLDDDHKFSNGEQEVVVIPKEANQLRVIV